MKLRKLFCFMICFAAFGITSSFAVGNESPSLFLPENYYDFQMAMEGSDVIHDFVIQNKGTALLKIENVKSG